MAKRLNGLWRLKSIEDNNPDLFDSHLHAYKYVDCIFDLNANQCLGVHVNHRIVKIFRYQYPHDTPDSVMFRDETGYMYRCIVEPSELTLTIHTDTRRYRFIRHERDR